MNRLRFCKCDRSRSTSSWIAQLAVPCLVFFVASAPAADAQVNDSVRSSDAAFPQFGFSVRWPDNWRVFRTPTATDVRFGVQKFYQPGNADESAFCLVSLAPAPLTENDAQAALDAKVQVGHPSSDQIETLLHANGGLNMKVYNPGVYTLGGHPSLTYEIANMAQTNAGTIYSYALVATLNTPGRQYTVRCQALAKQSEERAHMLFQISSQSILGFLGSLTLLTQ